MTTSSNTLELTPEPSARLAAFYLIFAIGALIMPWLSGLHVTVAGAIDVVALVLLCWHWRIFFARGYGGRVIRVVVRDHHWRLWRLDGREEEAWQLQQAWLTAGLILLRLRRRRQWQTLILGVDSMDAEQWRLLRVVLLTRWPEPAAPE